MMLQKKVLGNYDAVITYDGAILFDNELGKLVASDVEE